MSKLITYLLIFLGCLSNLYSQDLREKGVPYLRNFPPAEYDNKGKVWAIESAPNGIIYMASDKGMIEYDGRNWNYFKGSDGIIRSVLVDNDSLIYTGSDRDFGVWNRDRYNDFVYTSLYPFREDLNSINEEFWGLHRIGEITFFISSDNIYAFSGGNLTKIAAPARIEDSFQTEGALYFVSVDDQLYQLEDLSPSPVLELSSFSGSELAGLFVDDGVLNLVTKNEGLYQISNGDLREVETPISALLKNSNVFSFEQIGDSRLAFGTVLNGLYISDTDGMVIHHINKNKGLQNNTILSMHISRAGKLWLGMDYGLSYLDLSDKFSYLFDLRGDFGTGYAAELQDGQFYLGTNQGLYRADWPDLDNSTDLNKFELIPGSEGQVWALEIIDDQLWIGHDRGLFRLKGNELEEISTRSGFWNVQKYKDHIIAGSYNGISIFGQQGGDWEYMRQMELILGSCNQVIIDDSDTLWVNIPNYGVIIAELSTELYPKDRKIYEKDRFEGADQYLEIENNEVYVNTDSFQYSYRPVEDRFDKTDLVTPDNRIHEFKIPSLPPEILNENYEFYPVYNGFALKDRRSEEVEMTSDQFLLIRKVEAYNTLDSYQVSEGEEIGHKYNNLRIEAIVPGLDGVMYQFRSGNSGPWSEWTDTGDFEFINMDYGQNTISVRAMINGDISTNESITLTVMTPWYSSWYAYVIFSFFIIVIFYLLYYWQSITLHQQKKELLSDQKRSLKEQGEKHREELQKVREEKLKIKNEKLKDRLKNKTIELANKARENEEKNEVLKELKSKLKKVENNPSSVGSIITEMEKILNKYMNLDDNTFEIQLDELHQKFFETLRSKYSDLTLYDLRLCAYLKLGFDTKEISSLLNIKPSSVYISRSRLRKKLDMDNDEDLHTYLNSL